MQAENLVKLKVSNILNQARPKGPTEPKGRTPFYIMAVAILFTTLSFQIAGVFFSIAFIALLAWSLTTGRRQWSPARATGIMLMVSLSILSGCGPLLSSPPKEIITFCNNKIGTCKTGTASSWVICGYQLNDISVETARLAGGLEDVFAIDRAEGFGLIAVKRITVYGG